MGSGRDLRGVSPRYCRVRRLMPARTSLRVVALLVIGVFACNAAIRGHGPVTPSEWLAPVAPAVSLAAAGLLIFDRYAWRWPGVRRLVGRPVLHGTWHGELTSDWIDPSTGQRIPGDSDVFLVVRQRYWSVSVRLFTKESASVSTLAGFTVDADGVQRLVCVYLNAPRPEVRHRSTLHYGSVVLDPPLEGETGLAGEYFTGRGTTGELRFGQHVSTLAGSHAGGAHLVATGACR